MSSDYIQRHLHLGEQLVPDASILQEAGVIVITSEPGAGKTELLRYLARQSGVRAIAATVFRASSLPIDPGMLIVDGLDEVARVDASGIDAILVKACEATTRTVVISTRAYIWDESRSKLVKDCCGQEPKLLRLQPFNRPEQERLFSSYLPGEDFEAFLTEARRFELTPLLGNPQFLQMFGDAYVESGRKFSTKRQIYTDAVKRLTRERKDAPNQLDRPPSERLADAASEIYAKLLLAGDAGIATADSASDDDYPFIRSLTKADATVASAILDTRLFKPADELGKHVPVHRIIEEYCAAQYLVRRVEDASDRLSLGRCLAVIAPNAAVRDELRGMLGWMATLGGARTQEKIIDLDPYAVFANGDPSLLSLASKRLLLARLAKLADVDPYFRRVDTWRRFSAAGYFSPDLVDALRTQLQVVDHVTHLQGLLLELMRGSSVVALLIPELKSLLLAPDAPKETRALALDCLGDLDDYDYTDVFDALIAEGSAESVRMAADIVIEKGAQTFSADRVVDLLLRCANLYPKLGTRERTLGSRYFIRKLTGSFTVDEACAYLERLVPKLACTCGATKIWRCNCRHGKSKIAGLLLDRYFEGATAPYDPVQIWRWVKPLAFSHNAGDEKSAAVGVLSSDVALRRSIYHLAFDGLDTLDDIHEVAGHFFVGHGHAGLRMTPDDMQAVVDHAFETGNVLLWQGFFRQHHLYSEKRPNPLRNHMREQTRGPGGAPFLRIWAKLERHCRLRVREERRDAGYSSRRYERRAAEEKASRHVGFQRDIALIEAGRHWGWLQQFAHYYLHQQEEVEEAKAYLGIIDRSLRSCLPFLAPHTPSLNELAEHRGDAVAHVLHAACLAIFREKGILDHVALSVLNAVKTDGGGHDGYLDGEQERFEREINRRILSTPGEKIAFARDFIEPQLANENNVALQLGLFRRDAVFADVRPSLAMAWLAQFPAMPFDALDQLFDTCASEGDRHQLLALIDKRCHEPLLLSGDAKRDELLRQRRQFWLLRHFFFVTPISERLWQEFCVDDGSVLSIESRAGRFQQGDSKGWPPLNAEKVFYILRRYAPAWPKVDLPSHFGTGDPPGEAACRFLFDVIWQIGRDDPASAISVLDRVLADATLKDYWDIAKSIRAESLRKQALADFSPPKAAAVNALLDLGSLATVEDLRALFIELLSELQIWLKGGATTPLDAFYNGAKHVDENTVRDRIVEMLQFRLNALNLSVNVEQQMANENRCDITASAVIDGRPFLLPIEAKGQWHAEIFTAASAQLADRYSIYPAAAQQGLYLVFWFGADEKVAGKKNDAITSAGQLQMEIGAAMPETLRPLIDVVVLDLSR